MMYYPSSISDNRDPPPPFRDGSRAPFPPSEKNAYKKKSVCQIGTKFYFSNHVLSLFHFQNPLPLPPSRGGSIGRSLHREKNASEATRSETRYSTIYIYNHVDSDSLCQGRQPILSSHLHFPLYCCRRLLNITIAKATNRTRERQYCRTRHVHQRQRGNARRTRNAFQHVRGR